MQFYKCNEVMHAQLIGKKSFVVLFKFNSMLKKVVLQFFS